MNALPAALWSKRWRGADLAVFATGDDSPLSVEDALALISADERTRAGRFHFATDRTRWIRSRALLRLCLSHRLPVAAERLTFQTGAHGKPWLPEYPACHFNLSHSSEFAAIAIGPAPLGIDIEIPREDIAVASLAAHAFSQDEAESLTNSAAPFLLFYRMWTAKEAVMKCTGAGMSLAPAMIATPCDSRGNPCRATRLDDQSFFEILTHTEAGMFVLAAAVLRLNGQPHHHS